MPGRRSDRTEVAVEVFQPLGVHPELQVDQDVTEVADHVLLWVVTGFGLESEECFLGKRSWSQGLRA